MHTDLLFGREKTHRKGAKYTKNTGWGKEKRIMIVHQTSDL